MDELKTYVVFGVLLVALVSVTSGLSPPTIVSNEEEFILKPNSMFNISCTGKRNVIWADPLPQNTLVYTGYYTATLFISNATVENTGYYMCVYDSQEGELQGDPDDDNEAGIYVFVPDAQAPFVP
ncbi:Platelet-derived growth factor receptor alpha [Larimichthys crocea]|nr:Platelet-derived growth factor receptor alpha [Larimichthys crocea]